MSCKSKFNKGIFFYVMTFLALVTQASRGLLRWLKFFCIGKVENTVFPRNVWTNYNPQGLEVIQSTYPSYTKCFCQILKHLAFDLFWRIYTILKRGVGAMLRPCHWVLDPAHNVCMGPLLRDLAYGLRCPRSISSKANVASPRRFHGTKSP